MQLGTRWTVGAEPPASVPAELRSAIADVEARALGQAQGLDARWTLTWLEGRPIAELDAGWEVFVDAAGEVVAREFED